jgi:hypothetical protein
VDLVKHRYGSAPCTGDCELCWSSCGDSPHDSNDCCAAGTRVSSVAHAQPAVHIVIIDLLKTLPLCDNTVLFCLVQYCLVLLQGSQRVLCAPLCAAADAAATGAAKER